MTHIYLMPEDKDKTISEIQQAVSSYFLIREPDGSKGLIVGSHIVKFVARQEPTGQWSLILHLSDGSKQEISTGWVQGFVEKLFGKAEPQD